jgi:hypothetical protein
MAGLLDELDQPAPQQAPPYRLSPLDLDALAAIAAAPGLAARAMTSGLVDYLTKEPPPPSYEPNAAGKIPPLGYNPYEAGAIWDAFNLATMVTPAGAGKTLAMAGIPAATRAARAAKTLPMDTASRMARAEEMGIRMNLPLAHGTAPIQPIMAFDPARGAATTGAAPARMGVWSQVLRPGQGSGIADEFAEMAAAKTGGNPQVMPLVHRTEKPASIRLTGEELNHEIVATLDDLWSKGYDAVMLKNYTSPGGKVGDILVVKDPAQLRSPYAQFDPAKRNSANLLASGAGAAVLGPSLSEIMGSR